MFNVGVGEVCGCVFTIKNIQDMLHVSKASWVLKNKKALSAFRGKGL